MEGEDSIEMFQAITGADRPTSEHVLEAHGWDLNRSVNFFMESATLPIARAEAEPARERLGDRMPTSERRSAIKEQLNAARQLRVSSGFEEIGSSEPSGGSQELPEIPQPSVRQARSASAAEDEDLQAALAASLKTGDGGSEDEEEDNANAQRNFRAYDATEEPPEMPGVSTRAARSARAASLFDLPPDVADSPRVRRNRPRRAAAAAHADEDYMAAMGFADIPPPPFPPAMPAAFPGSLLHPGLRSIDHSPPSGSPTAANGNGHLEMPAGINMEEARMLEAAMLGIPYEGRMPEFGNQEPAEPVSPSVLRQRELREEQDQAYQESLLADKQKADAADAAKRTHEEQKLKMLQEEEDAAQLQRDYEREISNKSASLPPEPLAIDGGAVSIMIRLPNGHRFSRRFLRSSTCKDLFNFVDVNAAPDFKPETYKLVTQFPRRVFAADRSVSLEDAGIIQKQEALFLEPQ